MRCFAAFFLGLFLWLPVLADGVFWLTYPDGSRRSFESYEQAYEALVDLLIGSQDGRLVLTLEGRKIDILKAGPRLEVSLDGGPASQESVKDYLNKLDEARDMARQAVCRGNLKTLRQALELWAQDHDGDYPSRLQALTPAYVRSIPSCPFTSSDSYSESYQPGSSDCRCVGQHAGRD